MVFIAEAIVHKDTVVIKFLNASIAEITVVSIFRSQVLTVNTDVIKVVLFLDQLVKQLLEIIWGFNVAWIHKHSQQVKYHGCKEKDTRHDVPKCKPVASSAWQNILLPNSTGYKNQNINDIED